MTWLAAKINERVQILLPRLVPNDEGGGDFLFGNPLGDGFDAGGFEQLAPVKTVWMGFEPISFKDSGAKYFRGEQVNESVTHGFLVRRIAVDDLGEEFDKGFSIGFKNMPNLMNLKADYFLLVQRGSSVKGRLFRIDSIIDHKEQREYLKIAAEEIEERGVGWNA